MAQKKIRLHRPLIRGTVAALREIFVEGRYADKVVQNLFKENRKWGKRDRAFVAENTYDIVRWWRKMWYLGFGLEDMDELPLDDDANLIRLLGVCLVLKGIELPSWPGFENISPEEISVREKEVAGKRAIAQSVPDWLDEMAVSEIGEEWGTEIEALNQQTRIVLRANTLVTDRESLHMALNGSAWFCDEVPFTPDALVLHKRGNIFTHALFKEGFFEVQDAGSQCIAPFLRPEPGMTVVDACAGAGGKTLHLAALMENRGNIIALDTEARKLEELRLRAQRAGVHIVRTQAIDSQKVIERLHGTADRVLLDVPCSGLGVLRRNPDTKWKLLPQNLDKLQNIQADILEKYSLMLRPGGRLVYATCSILPSENENQVAAFLEKNRDFEKVGERKISPAKDGFDGFYMAALARR